jgi:aspartate-semialdehyde dehydrogenase
MKAAYVGWRGMVGQVLLERLELHQLMTPIDWTYFSTSKAGEKSPQGSIIKDASSIEELLKMDLILTCQGSDYSQKIYPQLMKAGFKGFWIDAASCFRMNPEATLVLDPINNHAIDEALKDGKKLFVGANCTVSLMLLALSGLFKENLIQWVSSMTYQAASGAGAKQLGELFLQSKKMSELDHVNANVLELEKSFKSLAAHPAFPKEHLGYNLNFNLLPWIDSLMENGQTKEEWKAGAEGNKILNTSAFIPIDGTCVRVGALRCHSQALLIKLKKDLPLQEIEMKIKKAHEWIRFVPNSKEATINSLTPFSVSGTLDIAVGRVRKMNLGPEYLNVFTCGDQLLWGAAEPLARMIKKLI